MYFAFWCLLHISNFINFILLKVSKYIMTDDRSIIMINANHQELNFHDVLDFENESIFSKQNILTYRHNFQRKHFQDMWSKVIGRDSMTCFYEDKDCSVFCIATAFLIPYDNAHKYLKENGRRHQSSCKNWENKILDGLIKDKLIVSLKEAAYKNYNKSKKKWCNIRVHTFLKKFPKGTFILTLSEHVLTVRDGYLIDRINSSKYIVLEAHQVNI